MREWPKVSAGELQASGKLLVEDGNHGEYRPRPHEFTDQGAAYIRAADLRGGVIDFNGAAKITDSALGRIRKGIGEPRDVILTHKGTVGTVAIAPFDCPSYVCSPQTTFWRSLDPHQLSQDFLFYVVRSRNFQEQLDRAAHETDMAPYASLTDQKSLQIPLPPLPEQQAIAEVLGALDDKIAANRALVSSVLQLVALEHKGVHEAMDTRRARYEDMAEIGGGGTPSTKEPTYWDGDIAWAAPSDLTALAAPYLESTPRRITSAGLAACASPLYPVGSILMTSRATIGAFAVNQVPTAVNQGFIVVQPYSEHLQWWLLSEMQSQVPEFLNRANGATFLELPRRAFRSMECALPDEDTLKRFHAMADRLHGRALAATRESTTLASLRDTLLPALMDGTIRVKDAEKTVSEAV